MMVVDAELIDAFNQSYAALRNDRGKSDIELARLQAILDTLIRQLTDQAIDSFENMFLEELRVQLRRLLNEEFAYLVSFRGLKGQLGRRGSVATPELDARRHFFGCLKPHVVTEILSLAEPAIARLRANAASNQLTRESLSVNSGRVVKGILKILNREFRSIGVNAAVSAYTGRSMRAAGAALELSVPQATWWRNAFNDLPRPPQTLYAHLDETINAPKAIVYLSDVGPGNGPTSCYPGLFADLGVSPIQALVGRVVGIVGNDPESLLYTYYSKAYHQSMTSESFRHHFMRLPEEVRFNSHFGWDVMPGDALEKEMKAREVAMIGPAGTFMIFDGATLVHRGGMVETGSRVALQVVFGESSVRVRFDRIARHFFSRLIR